MVNMFGMRFLVYIEGKLVTSYCTIIAATSLPLRHNLCMHRGKLREESHSVRPLRPPNPPLDYLVNLGNSIFARLNFKPLPVILPTSITPFCDTLLAKLEMDQPFNAMGVRHFSYSFRYPSHWVRGALVIIRLAPSICRGCLRRRIR